MSLESLSRAAQRPAVALLLGVALAVLVEFLAWDGLGGKVGRIGDRVIISFDAP